MTTAHPDSIEQTGLLLVISGPSGVGKTTITHAIEERFDGVFSISATTRPKTDADVEGRDYYFLDEESFKARLAGGEFLEHAQVFGKHWYGTPRGPVEEHLQAGRLVILEIDVQGALQIRESMPGAFMIFIEAPSEDELLNRLRSRARESEDVIVRRFAEAKHEIQVARESGAYDAVVVNDDLDCAINAACGLVDARRGALR